MQRWLSGFRGTALMVLVWTVGWGVGFGGLIEAFVDPHGELVDIWPAAMGFSGAIGGAVLSTLIRFAERRRRFDEISIPRFTTWGVVTGLVLGVLAIAIGLTSDIAIDTPLVRPVAPSVLIGIATGLGAVAAIGSAVLFRLVAREQPRTVAGPNG
ncbi:MAG: hypothetical protein ACREOG_07225 [Gemmatimonadaceae bacterium]